MQQIHHYTTIETLALILKYKTLRFTRLDLLDDKLEGDDFGIYNPLKYIFASSWTKDNKENISLWKMYSSLETGVRITVPLDIDIFPRFEVTYRDVLPVAYSQSSERNKHIDEAMNAPFNKDGIDGYFFNSQVSPTKHYNDDYMISPGDTQINYEDIIYDNEYLSKYKQLMRTVDGTYQIFNYQEFGKYKTEYWQFQKESRFIIITTPSCGEEQDSITRNYLNKDLKTKNIDIDLNDDFFGNLIITLAPKITDGNRVIVESLTNNNPSITINESELKDIIRK